MIKTLRKIMLAACAALLLCSAFVGSLSHTSAFSAALDAEPVSTFESLAPITAAGDTTTEKMYVYDGDENQLYYNRVTGMVFSEKGVVYNQNSQPLTYDDNAQQFEDSLQRRLDLIERSTGGLQNYYLMFGEYHVNSISIDDTLFIVGIAAKTAFNSGAAYDMLVKRAWVKYGFWDNFLAVARGDFSGGYYNYYDLHSQKIDSRYFEKTRSNGFLIAGSGTGSLVGTVLTKFEKWGTIKDLLEEICYLMEVVPPTGSPMGEFALNTATGGYLRDNRGQKIRIADNGQLIDPLSWPLVGADARPLWWREDLRAYLNHSGELLNYDNTDNILKDGSGFVAYSAITRMEAGLSITLIYLADGVSLLPVTMKLISIEPQKIEYYDMNGSLVNINEVVEPDFDEGDLKANWPEEFNTEPQWIKDFKDFFDGIKEWFSDIGNGISEFFTSVANFLGKYGKWIIIGIAGFTLLSILGIAMPVVGPMIQMAFKAVGKGIAAVFKAIGKGIAAIFKMLFKGIGFLFKSLFKGIVALCEGLFFLISWPFKKIAEKISQRGEG